MKHPLIRIVDDDQEQRQSMAFVLEMIGWETCCYASALDFCRNDDASRPGCLILDVRMPKMTGMELQEHLRAVKNNLPIIFLSAHGDIHMAVRALKNGAHDFLEKPASPDELKNAVARAVDVSLAQTTRAEETQQIQRLLGQLTPREREVAQLLAQGLLNKLIADRLNISLATVKMHRGNICTKLGVRSAVEVAALLHQESLDD